MNAHVFVTFYILYGLCNADIYKCSTCDAVVNSDSFLAGFADELVGANFEKADFVLKSGSYSSSCVRREI